MTMNTPPAADRDGTRHEGALFEAARMGDIATLRWFFENGCDVDHQVGKKKDFAASRRGQRILILLIPVASSSHTGQ